MTGAVRNIPSQPLCTLAPKTASGGKIRAHRIAPERMPRNRLYRLRKTQLCGQTRIGAHILGNTIGNAVAGGISGSQDTSAQGQQGGGSNPPNSFNGPISNLGNVNLPNPYAGSTNLNVPGLGSVLATGNDLAQGLPIGSTEQAIATQILAQTAPAVGNSAGGSASYNVPVSNGMYAGDKNTSAPGSGNPYFYNRATGSIDFLQLSPDGTTETEVPDAYRTALLQQAQSQLNWGVAGFLGISAGGALLASTSPAWLAGLGYAGSGSTIGGSLAVKATIGLGSEWGANALTGQDMTFAKGAGAVAGSVIFAPGVGKLAEASPLFVNLVASGAAAGGGGNSVEQYIDYLNEGKAFSGRGLLWSTGFGAIGGAGGWANMKILPTPTYLSLNPIANSLHDDVVKLPAAAGAVPALVAQKVIPVPRWVPGW